MSLGIVASARAANDHVYYAQTGLDGIIHCAEGSHVAYASGSGIQTGATTLTKRDLFCSNTEAYPAGYLQSQMILKRNGAVYVAWYWDSNPAPAWYFSQTFFVSQSGSYELITSHRAAVNLAWRSLDPNHSIYFSL